MTSNRAYLDYNATSPLRPEARSAMLAALDAGGNPSSVHAEGRRARATIERAREQVAALVGAEPRQVVFTSGATESANAVLRRSWRTIHLARVEHPCVVAPSMASSGRVEDLAVAETGLIDLAALRGVLPDDADRGQSLIAVQFANNETGVVQPIGEIAAIARERGVAVLCDAVQAAGRVAIDFAGLGIDFMLVSSHKIGGPKGIGALIVRDPASLPPMIIGGGQESRRRAGTENVEGIAGFGAAAAAARRDLDDMGRIAALRDGIVAAARAIRSDTVVVSESVPRLANTAMIAVPGTRAETLVIKLDLAGVAISAGSACASGKVGQSPVLVAMGVAADVARAAVRISLGHASSERDVETFAAAWRTAIPEPGTATHFESRSAAPAVAEVKTRIAAATAAATMGE